MRSEGAYETVGHGVPLKGNIRGGKALFREEEELHDPRRHSELLRQGHEEEHG